MKKPLALALVLALALALSPLATAMADEGHGEDKPLFKMHHIDSMVGYGENGHFMVEILATDGTFSPGINTVDFGVHDSGNNDVADAEIILTTWMPAMEHGSDIVPIVMNEGGGRYSITDLGFVMSGKWELRFEITSGGVTDKVVITTDVKKKFPAI